MSKLSRKEVEAHKKRAQAWGASLWPREVLDVLPDADKVTIETLIDDSVKHDDALLQAWDALEVVDKELKDFFYRAPEIQGSIVKVLRGRIAKALPREE